MCNSLPSLVIASSFLKLPQIGKRTGACPLQYSGFPCHKYSIPKGLLIDESVPPTELKVNERNFLNNIP